MYDDRVEFNVKTLIKFYPRNPWLYLIIILCINIDYIYIFIISYSCNMPSSLSVLNNQNNSSDSFWNYPQQNNNLYQDLRKYFVQFVDQNQWRINFPINAKHSFTLSLHCLTKMRNFNKQVPKTQLYFFTFLSD